MKKILNNKYTKILIVIVVLFLAYSIYQAMKFKKEVENWRKQLKDNLLFIIKESKGNLKLNSTVLEFQELINTQTKVKLDSLETDKQRKFLIDKLMSYESGSSLLTMTLNTFLDSQINWVLKNDKKSTWLNKLIA